VIGALLLGLVAGFIGRALVPNDALQDLEGPKSWLASIVLGLVGAAVGWAIFTAGLGIGDTDVFDWGGIISALIGVVIVLLVVTFVMRRVAGAGPRPPRSRKRRTVSGSGPRRGSRTGAPRCR
jgi:uncharacterized membrane protein YeaQ/YmgE (transglycosylase-associated protein family)